MVLFEIISAGAIGPYTSDDQAQSTGQVLGDSLFSGQILRTNNSTLVRDHGLPWSGKGALTGLGQTSLCNQHFECHNPHEAVFEFMGVYGARKPWRGFQNNGDGICETKDSGQSQCHSPWAFPSQIAGTEEELLAMQDTPMPGAIYLRPSGRSGK